MIKISSAAYTRGEVWDHMGKSKIVQIFISYDDFGIYFVQFVYDEGGKFVLSERPAGAGTMNGRKFNTIKLNYKEEFLTSLGGTYRHTSRGGFTITSLSFGTNRGNHGPFGSTNRGRPAGDDETFNFQLGEDRSFGGFHGTTVDGVLESIGVYVKPLTSSTLL
ncbi:Protein RESTRICTED TEV MOVEMENT like [Actinidia chinensis var. chinensis]|uniref:Protein RESTRICTED TEV MOVEMENT like n=1 Tax=Actinidia chinensis var. chinensis TaxID=1590841 RepID=A0A2R6P473_ACTCC|nr:Protein RESTRICTED TEV MOVEMENT like [Actinidia chinensis var. chinensis]